MVHNFVKNIYKKLECMSILDINRELPEYDPNIIKHALQQYFDYYKISYGDYFSKKLKIKIDIEITDQNLHDLILYREPDDPYTLNIIKSRLVYRRGWRLIYKPYVVSKTLQLLTLKDVFDFVNNN